MVSFRITWSVDPFTINKMAEVGDENTPLLKNDTPGEPPPNYNDGNTF